MSARSVLSVLDTAKYEVTQIGITHEGTWLTGEDVLGKFENNQTEGLLPVVFFLILQKKVFTFWKEFQVSRNG